MNSCKGASLFQVILLLVVAGFFALLGVRLAPPYSEYYTVKEALYNVTKSPKIKTLDESEIKDLFSKNLFINGIKHFDGKELVVTKRNGNLTLELKYDVTVHIIGNVDARIKFDKKVEVE